MTILSGISYFAALTIFSVYHKNKLITDLPKLNTRFYALIAVSAILTGFLANTLYYKLIKSHPAFLVTALTYTAPLFTVLFAALLLKEKVTRYQVIGVVLVVSGSSVM